MVLSRKYNLFNSELDYIIYLRSDFVVVIQMPEETRRKKIIDILLESENPISPEEIAIRLDEQNVNLIYSDMEHVVKTLKSLNYKVIAEPPVCKKCGYVFKKTLYKKPSRCPKCKSEWIQEPRYLVRRKK